ncbi:MAG: bifunctional 4-hydroxy-2-oxoglutarate aldolase/2-dehydro-3-deoxy-phosphogluconate aldolase [Bacteroidetes bacterium]|nr:bifunctional 4-hydroxy-2-oxoglutarate aldolase/2-dehydro-3-deoxy-phosphogluconate aldolase [Bacteroidota bacterium]
MESEQYHSKKIREQGLLPLFYHEDMEVCLSVASALYAGGIRAIEFTNRGDQALKNFTALVKEKETSMKGLMLCIGTIKTAEQASKFMDAGAEVLISPVFDSSVCDVAYMQKMLWIPGCSTPTEIHVAEKAGCSLVKLFPGELLKPSFISAVKPLFPNIDFMVTGGVEASKENIAAWFQAGASAVGLGSKLISKEILAGKDYQQISKKTKELMDIVKSLK